MDYTVHYEIAVPGKDNVVGDMYVEADTKERAVEHARNVLEEEYEGRDCTLLVCEVK